MKKYSYVYITTNLINGKQYVGDHSTNNLNDNYLGSGLFLIRAIKKYGIENFKKEIIESFNTKKEAFDAQEKYIKLYNTLYPNGYNLSPKGGHQCKDGVSDYTKKLLSIAVKTQFSSKDYRIEHGKITKNAMNNPVIKNKQCSSRRKRLPHSIETKQKMSKSRIGKTHSDETKEKMRSSRLGKKYKTLKLSINCPDVNLL